MVGLLLLFTAVFLFFGLIAVSASYYLQTGTVSAISLTAGAVLGLPAAAVLAHIVKGVISLTGNPQSALAGAANVNIDVGVAEEACPLGLAPTASTTAALAMETISSQLAARVRSSAIFASPR